MARSPLSEDVAAAIAKCFEGGAGPSHQHLSEVFDRPVVRRYEPPQVNGLNVSKARRVRAVLSGLARTGSAADAHTTLEALLARMRVTACFDPKADSFVGEACLRIVHDALHTQGWDLDRQGTLRPLVLADLNHAQRRPVIDAEIDRLRRASDDAPLLLGTAKELLETTSRYVLEEIGQPARDSANFDELLHLARNRLGLLPQDVSATDEVGRAVREMYEGLAKVARSVNVLRNREGTGHGRAKEPRIAAATAIGVVQSAAVLAQVMLTTLDTQYKSRTAA